MTPLERKQAARIAELEALVVKCEGQISHLRDEIDILDRQAAKDRALREACAPRTLAVIADEIGWLPESGVEEWRLRIAWLREIARLAREAREAAK